jgi:hypothetical protein
MEQPGSGFPSSYPSGLAWSGYTGAVEPYEQGPTVGDDPSYISGSVMEMSLFWDPIDVCVLGTQYFRQRATLYLPQEPEEDQQAWQRRIYHATMAPFLVRIAEQAAALILRKPIQLEPAEQGGEVDSYWEDWVSNVDGRGSDLDTFARRLVISSILYGHASILVDYPSQEPAANLQAERDMGLAPYLSHVDIKQILGWRVESTAPNSKLSQVRIDEWVTEQIGEFGEEQVRQIRVLEPGRWRVFRLVGDSQNGRRWTLHAEGTTSLDRIPLATAYSNKVDELRSKPPLVEVAHLNIAHGQRTADLTHALHVAALPSLVLKGFDDQGGKIGLSANTAIMLPPEGDASYVEPTIAAFDAQQARITELERQIESLGISTLFAQRMGAETAESKRLSRTDSDSLLSVVSKDVEDALQKAVDIAAEFVGAAAPMVRLDRDFDLQVLDAGQVTQYQSLWQNGAISHETLLRMLRQGEVLPDIDIEAEIEMTDQEKAQSMALQADLFAAQQGQPAGESGPSSEEEDQDDEREDEDEEEQQN